MYGGSTRWTGAPETVANIFLRGGGGAASKLRLENVKVAGSGKYGIFLERNSIVEPCSEVTFEDNNDLNTDGAGTVACN